MMALDSRTALRSIRLTKRFGGLTAVDDLTLSVSVGESLGIIGPNGAGKSTALDLLSRAQDPTAGEVWYGDRDITSLPQHKILALGIARTFQRPRISPQLSVLENVMVGRIALEGGGLLESLANVARSRSAFSSARARAEAALERVGLTGRIGTDVKGLPFGDLRRMEIARALVAEPAILLLDEALSGTTTVETEQLLQLTAELHADGLGVVLIEHNVGAVFRLCARIAVLNFGRKIAEGTPADIRVHEDVVAAYLGSSGKQHALD